MKHLAPMSLLLVFAACGGPRIGEVSHDPSRVVPLTLETGCENEPSDSITVHGVELADQRLRIDVAHGGGCEEHTYRICAADHVLRTYPGQWVFTVLHDANGDECDAEHFRVLEAELEPRRDIIGFSNLEGRSFTADVE